MKLYSKLGLVLCFGMTVLMISIGAVGEFLKEYYPVAKTAVISFLRKQFRSFYLRSNNRYGGVSAI